MGKHSLSLMEGRLRPVGAIMPILAVTLMAACPNVASASSASACQVNESVSSEAGSNRAPGVIYDKQTYIRDGVCYRFHANGTAEVINYDLYYPEYTRETFYKGDVVIPSTVSFDETKSFTVTTISGLSGDLVESLTLAPTVTKIANYAISCDNLKTINFSEGIIEIGNGAFAGCNALTSVELPNSLQTLGETAFSNCASLTHVKVGSGLTTMGLTPFQNCPDLTSIEVDPSNAKYDSRNNCNAIIETATNALLTGCKSTVIPQGVKSIEVWAFKNCVGLTSIEIPSSVKTLGSSFIDCADLKTVKLNEGLERLWGSTFENCTGLESLEFPSTVTYIGGDCVKGAENLVTIILNPGIKEIKKRAFVSCGIKSFVIPNTVETVEAEAFGWCKSLEELVVPASVKTFDYGAVNNTKIPSSTNMSWKEVNQVSVTVAVEEEATAFFYKGERVDGTELKIGNLDPGSSINIKHGELSYLDKDGQLKLIGGSHGTSTKKIEPLITVKDGYSLSSAEITFSHVEGDAYINLREYKINGKSSQLVSDPATITLTDLDTETTIEYTLTVKMKPYTVTRKLDIPLVLDTQSAKAISNTSALICCKTSLGEDCMRAGFEWRRVDAPEIVESSKAPCAIINGEMLGALHNLSSNTYYQYRPYYQASSGNYYYGEWKGFGTADAYVYFEPIVRTSQASQVTETTALLAGSSVAGSDEIIKQGFEYGEYASGSEVMAMDAEAATGNGTQIEVSGTNMQVTVENLEPGTDYWFRAFVTTASGTTYGDTLSFKTEGEKHGSVNEIETDGNMATEVARYDLQGNRVSRNHPGIHVVVMSDGSVVKVVNAEGK